MDYKITTRAFDKTDSVFFKSMLQLIHNQLTQKWVYAEDARIILVDLEQPEGIEFWISKPRDAFLIAYARQNFYRAEWFLQKPLRIQPLLQLLNSLAVLQPSPLLQQIQSPAVSPPPVATLKSVPAPPSAPPSGVSLPPVPSVFSKAMQYADTAAKKSWLDNKLEFFEPTLHLLGLIQETLSKNQPRRFNCLGASPLYILPSENRCYSTVLKQQLDPLQKTLYSSYTKNIQVADLTEIVLAEEVKSHHLRSYPIDTALWLAALNCSHGRLILEQVPDARVRLKHWPNFVVLPHDTVHVSLAAFMLKNSANLVTIAQKTHTPLENVVDFFNACKVIDLTVEEPAAELPLHSKQIAEPKRRTLRDILNRLLR